MTDPIEFVLKAEDMAPPAGPETVNPRRVRVQLAQLDGLLLEFQDDVTALFGDVTSSAGRRTLRALYGGLEDAHQRVGRIVTAVERGA